MVNMGDNAEIADFFSVVGKHNPNNLQIFQLQLQSKNTYSSILANGWKVSKGFLKNDCDQRSFSLQFLHLIFLINL